MNTKYKRKYQKPEISLIKLDNEISLQLESNPPYGPGETQNFKTQEYFNNNNSFKV